MSRLNVNDARCEALFASRLQRSDAVTAQAVTEAIRVAVREFGTRGCADVMAQEFGEHPEAAAERMHWVRQLLAGTLDCHVQNSPIAEWQQVATALQYRPAC
ncbi:MAG TPA: hypothetical protein VMH35_12450 [Streptosporangiaceae bacterium]|nr:hypothetical protein [Streptosporangiaceae bacterium]